MAKQYPYPCDIGNGQTIFYSIRERKERNKWMVNFPDPDPAKTRPVVRMTQHEIRGKTPPPEVHEDARRFILELYRPKTLFPVVTRKTWEECIALVEQKFPHTRPETIRSFRSAAKAITEVFPSLESPLDLSEDRAKRFAVEWLSRPKARGTGRRSPTTLSYYVRALSALSNKLVDLEIVQRNIWSSVKVPKGETNKKPTPTEADAEHFTQWLHARFPGWTSLYSLIDLKAVSGCRTADVCQLRTSQLKNGGLTFSAGQTKTKVSRSLPLPDDLYQTLTSVAGPEHLWESLFKEIPLYRKMSNGLPSSFSWKTIYYLINNIFRDYREEFPDRYFSPHALRRRAITAIVFATGSVDKAAHAIGISPQTASKHYLDHERALSASDTMKAVADALRLKHTINTPKG